MEEAALRQVNGSGRGRGAGGGRGGRGEPPAASPAPPRVPLLPLPRALPPRPLRRAFVSPGSVPKSPPRDSDPRPASLGALRALGRGHEGGPCPKSVLPGK